MFAFIYASSPRMYSIFRLSITNRIESIFPNKSHQLFAMQKKKTPLFGFDENNARCWLAANTSKDSKQYRLYIVTILYTQLNPSQLIEQIHYRRCKERWNYGSDESKSTGEGPCCSSSSHMTSNPLSASPPHPTPLHSSPLLVSSSSRTFRHTGSTARLENDTILQEDRTLVKTASFVEQGYITSRVSPRALRSRFRERLKSKKKKTKRRESLSFHSLSLFDRRADSRYLRIDNRRGTTVIHIDRWLRNATREWWTFTFNHGVVTLCVGMSAR